MARRARSGRREPHGDPRACLQPRMPDTALRLLLGGLAIALAIVYAVQALT
jgi:hypothetical protein